MDQIPARRRARPGEPLLPQLCHRQRPRLGRDLQPRDPGGGADRDRRGVRHVEEIAAVPGVDVLFIGRATSPFRWATPATAWRGRRRRLPQGLRGGSRARSGGGHRLGGRSDGVPLRDGRAHVSCGSAWATCAPASTPLRRSFASRSHPREPPCMEWRLLPLPKALGTAEAVTASPFGARKERNTMTEIPNHNSSLCASTSYWTSWTSTGPTRPR